MRRKRVLAVGLALAGSGICGCSEEPKPTHTATYEAREFLAERLDVVEAIVAPRHPLSASRVEIGFDQRSALRLDPPARVRFLDLPSGPGARFETAPAVHPAAYDKSTDGLRFRVRCRGENGEWELLDTVELSPIDREKDRGWRDRSLSLASCSAPTTALELETDCGPREHCAADYALWARPTVIHEQAIHVRPRQLAILISIDTLRPDRLEPYGGSRPNSPSLARLATEGVTFLQAVASAPWTIPSHATMLTSTWPLRHGADGSHPVPAGTITLAEELSGAGWQTAGFTDTPYLGRQFGFEQGFDHFDDSPAPRGDFRRGAAVTRERLLRWLDGADDRPAFVFWHVMDVHGPYGAAAPFGGRFREDLETLDPQTLNHLGRLEYHKYLRLDRFRSLEDLVASYDEGIAEVDAVVGGLFDVLRDARVWDDALVLVTSDHGESLYDHEIWVGHGLFLTDDELRVPLILKLPGSRRAGSRIGELVGLVDLAPTVLHLLDLPPQGAFQGRSLFGGDRGRSGANGAVLFGESSNLGASFVRDDEHHYVTPAALDAERVESVHLRPPPGMDVPGLPALLRQQLYTIDRSYRQVPDPGPDGTAIEALRQALARHQREQVALRSGEGESPSAPDLSADEEERLRALGYAN